MGQHSAATMHSKTQQKYLQVDQLSLIGMDLTSTDYEISAGSAQFCNRPGPSQMR